MFYSCKKLISRKNPVLPIDKSPSLVLLRNVIILQHLIIQFMLYYPLYYGRLKTKGNFRRSTLKVNHNEITFSVIK